MEEIVINLVPNFTDSGYNPCNHYLTICGNCSGFLVCDKEDFEEQCIEEQRVLLSKFSCPSCGEEVMFTV